MPQIAVDQATFAAFGPIKHFKKKSDSGNDLSFAFCSECGSPLFKTTTLAPDVVFVPLGCLDHSDQYQPGRKVYEGSRRPWDE